MSWLDNLSSEFKAHRGVRLACLAASYVQGTDRETYALTLFALACAAKGDKARKGAPLVTVLNTFHTCAELKALFHTSEDLISQVWQTTKLERERYDAAVGALRARLMGVHHKFATHVLPGREPVMSRAEYDWSVERAAFHSTRGSSRFLKALLGGEPYRSLVARALDRVRTCQPRRSTVDWARLIAQRPTEGARDDLRQVLLGAEAGPRLAYGTVWHAAELYHLGAREVGLVDRVHTGYALKGEANDEPEPIDEATAPVIRPVWTPGVGGGDTAAPRRKSV